MPKAATFMRRLRPIDYTVTRSSRHGSLIRCRWQVGDLDTYPAREEGLYSTHAVLPAGYPRKECNCFPYDTSINSSRQCGELGHAHQRITGRHQALPERLCVKWFEIA